MTFKHITCSKCINWLTINCPMVITESDPFTGEECPLGIISNIDENTFYCANAKENEYDDD